MAPIDIAAIERRARQLRAEEIRRIEGLFAERMRITGRLLAESTFAGLLAVAAAIRPVFSWNPQAKVQQQAPAKPRIAVLKRLSRGLRSLFAWNPEVHHHL
ncbi:MAG: hypothetical protein QG616_1437 [Pseudomonadota bacterium]|nr:hypothetical protein [Pseudomonadota bacterium]MDQ5905843.1 hypothetical protein [Pseudomonadota bacterium]MDQ5915706.1 hypothetical protein [Pseudomonadota bacterium]MDQ5941222.1 hypothetical protein [Pseudomonadota bacterium]MDQ5945809.1 hypothetical protein [Pseudomonadota bacterium]